MLVVFARCITIVSIFCLNGLLAAQDEDPETKAKVDGLIKQLKSKKPADRLKAAEQLGELGTKAAAASRSLCDTLLDSQPSVRFAVSKSLEKVNPKIHKLASIMVFDNDDRNIHQAVLGLERLKEEALPAQTLVILYAQQCAANDRQTRRGMDAIVTLMAMSSDDKVVAQNLTNWLRFSKGIGMKQQSALALVKTPFAKDAVVHLVLALQTDESKHVRQAVCVALGQMGGDAKDAIKALEIAKTDSDRSVREAAAEALIMISGQ